jgi:hypothetical protein
LGLTRETRTRATFDSESTGAPAGVPLGRAFAFKDSPLCKFGLTLLPLAIAEVPAGPSKERSLRFVIELEVSERESSMPRGRAGAIVQFGKIESEIESNREKRADDSQRTR